MSRNLRLLTGAGRILIVLSKSRNGLTFTELQAATGMSSSLLDRNLKALIAEGLIERRGRLYVLTSDGLARVESLISEVIG